MWTLAIPSLLLCIPAVFTSIKAADPCATCTSAYNGTGDTNCSSLKTYLHCLETASGKTKPCALSAENALKIKNATCSPDLLKACSCQKGLWGTNGPNTDNCTALSTYVTCLTDKATLPNTTCTDGVNISSLLTNANARLADCQDPCRVQDCSGHGKCTLNETLPAKYFCKCNDSYEGEKCENEITPCSSKPCQNEGKCTVTAGNSNYTCKCTSGHSGRNCTEGPCKGHTCNNHGKCQADAKDKTKPMCVCNDGYSGDQCQTPSAASEISQSSFLASLLVVNIIWMTLT